MAIICPSCGGDIPSRLPGDTGPPRLYCSRECVARGQRARNARRCRIGLALERLAAEGDEAAVQLLARVGAVSRG